MIYRNLSGLWFQITSFTAVGPKIVLAEKKNEDEIHLREKIYLLNIIKQLQTCIRICFLLFFIIFT